MNQKYEALKEELRSRLLAAALPDVSYIVRDPGDAEGDNLVVECLHEGRTREIFHICRSFREEEKFTDDIPFLARKICKEITGLCARNLTEKILASAEYANARENLFIRPVRAGDRRLEQSIYRIVGDIALVLYMEIGSSDETLTSIRVGRNMLDQWGLSEEEVFRDAMTVTMSGHPPRSFDLELLLSSCGSFFAGFPFMEAKSWNYSGTGGICISTDDHMNGAVALFYPGVAKKIGELLDSDFLVAFTSIHEGMVHRINEIPVSDLAAILADTIRESTPEKDILTYSIYRYSRERDELGIIHEQSFL